MNIAETLIDIPAEHERNVFGQFDVFVKKIEQTLKVSVIPRDGTVKILGPENRGRQAARVLEQLLILSRRGNVIESTISYAIETGIDRGRLLVLESGNIALPVNF